jgi:hypothetical protein
MILTSPDKYTIPDLAMERARGPDGPPVPPFRHPESGAIARVRGAGERYGFALEAHFPSIFFMTPIDKADNIFAQVESACY